MKVVFKMPKLLPDSAIRSVIDKYTAQCADRAGWANTWNFNDDQKLSYEFNPHGNKITYEGQRHPFFQDGGFDVVINLFSGNREAASAAVCYYETSDKRLLWDETLSNYLERRAPFSHIVDAIIARKTMSGSWEFESIHRTVKTLEMWYKNVPAGLEAALLSPTKLVAGFTTEEQLPIKKLGAFIRRVFPQATAT